MQYISFFVLVLMAICAEKSTGKILIQCGAMVRNKELQGTTVWNSTCCESSREVTRPPATLAYYYPLGSRWISEINDWGTPGHYHRFHRDGGLTVKFGAFLNCIAIEHQVWVWAWATTIIGALKTVRSTPSPHSLPHPPPPQLSGSWSIGVSTN